MFRRFYEALLPVLLWPLLQAAKSAAANQAADAKADVYRRAQQAEDEGMPDLARQLRDHAATLGIDAPPDGPSPALPEPSANGHAPQLAAPPKPARPRKEASGGN